MHSCKVEMNHHGQTRKDVFLCIPPLYHTGAKMHWFGSLLSASKAVILKGTKPSQILKAVSDEGCTIVWLLVPWAQDILDAIERGEVSLSDYKISQWRLMHIGAQPVPPSLVKRWRTVFPNHEYDTNYGLSESIGPGCVHLGIGNYDKVGAIGKAGYGWETRIVDENGNDVVKGEVGELAVKGPGVMTCYYKDEKATEEVLKDGWLFTGDMAEEDKDGFIFLVDRKKDVIITGGENIYPVQIEDFIRSNDSVKDVAVIGLPDHRLGEITCAIIEVKEGKTLTEDDVNEFCRELPKPAACPLRIRDLDVQNFIHILLIVSEYEPSGSGKPPLCFSESVHPFIRRYKIVELNRDRDSPETTVCFYEYSVAPWYFRFRYADFGSRYRRAALRDDSKPGAVRSLI